MIKLELVVDRFFIILYNNCKHSSSCLRDIAQFGSAPALGAGCRRFKSCYPD